MIHSYWIIFVPPKVYKMTHTQACSDVWLIVLFLFSAQVDNIGDCMETLITVDDNNDQQGIYDYCSNTCRWSINAMETSKLFAMYSNGMLQHLKLCVNYIVCECFD